LVASRLILVTSNNILIFVSYNFSNKKQKKIVEMSSHCSRCAKLHLHLLFYQSSYKFLSLMFDLFFIETHHWTLNILKILFWFSLTTSLYALPIHIETSSSSCGLTTTKSLILRFINRVYVYLEKASSSLAHNKEQW